jgi:hypothetical protein
MTGRTFTVELTEEQITMVALQAPDEIVQRGDPCP